ncbi:MAG: glycosyltransferase [Clostridia bacterium]|nr:glycosyltransferase [Clostridia bacterium]
MKVLGINCVYNYGSTGRLVKSLHEGLLENDHESIVLYGRNPKSNDEGVYKTSSEFGAKIHSAFARLLGDEFAHSFFATKKAIKIIEREKPDVVHLHCLNGNFINVYSLIKYLKKNGIKTVLTLHADIMHTAGCEHAVDCEKWKTECHNCPKIRGKVSRLWRDDARRCYRKMKASIEGFSDLTVVGVSKWLTDRAAQSPIFEGCRFATVHNGVDTSVFRPTKSNKRAELGIGEDEKVVLHVTPDFRHDSIKGSRYVSALIKEMPEYKFIIVGKGTDGVSFPENVITVPHTSNTRELAEIYSLSNVTLLTSIRETYSMVCAESLCCGTPVAGFFAGGPESICLPEWSLFCPQGDMDALKANVKALASKEKTDFLSAAEREYSSASMYKNYMELYQSDETKG